MVKEYATILIDPKDEAIFNPAIEEVVTSLRAKYGDKAVTVTSGKIWQDDPGDYPPEAEHSFGEFNQVLDPS